MTTLRNATGSIIGTITEAGDKKIVRNANGTIVGTYSPSDNKTRNANGSIVGSGDQTAALLR
jgi:hypothetical protein